LPHVCIHSYAEHDIGTAMPSIRLSIHHTSLLYQNRQVFRQNSVTKFLSFCHCHSVILKEELLSVCVFLSYLTADVVNITSSSWCITVDLDYRTAGDALGDSGW